MTRVFKQYQLAAFYHTDDEFNWMANTFRGHPVSIEGKTWPTTEHYFQAQKFPNNQKYQNGILNYNGSYKDFPKFVRTLSKGLAFDSQAWDGDESMLNGRKHDVMRTALRAKLETYPALGMLLDELPPEVVIVESTQNDNKWGDGSPEGKGTNHLGILYMELKLLRANPGMSQIEATQLAAERYKAFQIERTAEYPRPLQELPHDPLSTPMERTYAKTGPETFLIAQVIKKNTTTPGFFTFSRDLKLSDAHVSKTADEKYNVILSFETQQAANDFCKLMSNKKPPVHLPAGSQGQLVVSQSNAIPVFKELRVVKYGKTAKHDIFDSLIHEYNKAHNPQSADSVTNAKSAMQGLKNSDSLDDEVKESPSI